MGDLSEKQAENDRYREIPENPYRKKGLTTVQKEVLMILYAKDCEPVKRTHLPFILKYWHYLKGEK